MEKIKKYRKCPALVLNSRRNSNLTVTSNPNRVQLLLSWTLIGISNFRITRNWAKYVNNHKINSSSLCALSIKRLHAWKLFKLLLVASLRQSEMMSDVRCRIWDNIYMMQNLGRSSAFQLIDPELDIANGKKRIFFSYFSQYGTLHSDSRLKMFLLQKSFPETYHYYLAKSCINQTCFVSIR